MQQSFDSIAFVGGGGHFCRQSFWIFFWVPILEKVLCVNEHAAAFQEILQTLTIRPPHLEPLRKQSVDERFGIEHTKGGVFHVAAELSGADKIMELTSGPSPSAFCVPPSHCTISSVYPAGSVWCQVMLSKGVLTINKNFLLFVFREICYLKSESSFIGTFLKLYTLPHSFILMKKSIQ